MTWQVARNSFSHIAVTTSVAAFACSPVTVGLLVVRASPSFTLLSSRFSVRVHVRFGVLSRQSSIFDPMRPVGLRTEPPTTIGFIVLVIALEPYDAAVTFESEHVRSDAIEEPSIVADDHGTTCVVDKRFFEGPERVDIQVIGGLIEQQQVRTALQQLGQVYPIAFTAGQRADLALLLRPLEIEPGHIGTRRDRTLPDGQFVEPS